RLITISQGLIAAAVFIGAANLVLPFLTSSASINLIAGNVSYLGIAVFIVCAAYAIIRHKLFDVRFFVVRAVAYALSIVLLALVCLLPIVWFISHVLDVRISALAFVLIVVFGIVSSLVYQYLKKLF